MDQGYSEEPHREKLKRNTTFCCVNQCSTYDAPDISFHYFPKETSLRRKWEVALKMGKPASNYMRVCSKHFSPQDYFPGVAKIRKLKRGSIPSQNLPKRTYDKPETSPMKRRKEGRAQRAALRQTENILQPLNLELQASDNDEVMEDLNEAPRPVVSMVDAATQANLVGHCASSEGNSLADFLAENSDDKAVQVNFMSESEGENEDDSEIVLPHLLVSDKRLFTFTGIHSLDLLDGLAESVSEIDPEHSTNKKVLSTKDRIILTLVKIKLNMRFTALAVLFGVNRRTCSNYFRHTSPLLARVLKSVIPWPDQAMIRSNLPTSFSKYSFTRIILDCMEIPIEKCKCLKCRILTYSQYKRGHTAKVNLGIAPSGLLTEISSLYGGRASDKFIVNDSCVLDRLDYQDGVMVDKGYRIENECCVRNLRLIRPPFLQKKGQLAKEEALDTADIARARVHVERVIQRLREYQMISGPMAWSLLPYADDILLIVCGLTNLGPPIMNIDKFM